MKKNKTTNKQFVRLFSIYIISFLLLYAILGFAVYKIVENKTFSDAEIELYEVERINSHHIVYSNKGDSLYAQLNNPQTLVIFYDEDKNVISDGYSKELLNYIIEDDRFGPKSYTNSEIEEALSNSIFVCNDNLGEINSFEKVVTNGKTYNFMTLSFAVASDNAQEISYCKTLIMVNSQINSLNNLMSVYLRISAIAFIILLALSLLLTHFAIKPIKESIEKEKTFISDASHELKTPLAIVQSKLENILTKSDATVMDVSQDLAISLNQVTRLNKLTNDLLTLARSDNNKEIIEYQECSITDCIKEVASIFQEMALIQEKEFTMDLEDINGTIDKDKLNQLVIILLDNALKYTNSEDKINIKLYKKQNDFYIEVSDTGIGISDEAKDRLFDRFYREDKSRSQETGGNGLGLSIAKNIVNSHNGKISVDHNSPKGTKFIASFPIKGK